MLADLWIAARTLRRSPGFAAVSIVVLALGIAANAMLFSVADAVLLQPFPFADPDRLIIAGENLIEPRSEITYRDFLAWREGAVMFDDMAAIGSSSWSWRFRTADEPIEVRFRAVSGHLFDLIGASALLGRTLRADDDRREATRVVVLSHGLWQRHFGGDVRAIGRSVTLGDASFTIVGVMPSAFRFPAGADLWTPLVPELAAIAANNSRAGNAEEIGVLYMVGRLKPGASVTTAQRDLDRINAQLVRSGVRRRAVEARVTTIADDILGPSRIRVLSLVGAAAIVLLVACGNIASLLLVRASARRREFAVRLALGASPGKLARHLFFEAVWLASAATVAAIVSAYALLPSLIALLPAEVPRLGDAGLNSRAIAFTGIVGLITAVVSSVAPAMSLARVDLEPVLRGSAHAVVTAGLRHPWRRALIVAQFAGGIVLLTAAGLLARSVVHLRQLDIGFAPTGLLAFEMSMPSEHMRELDARALLDDSARAIAEVPGVASVSQVSLHPLQGPIGLDSPFQREEQSREEAKHNPYVNTETIAPSYFATMRTPIVSGRGFTNDDRAGTTPVVILSQRFAQLAWPGQSALGKRLHVTALDPTDPPGQTMWTVIGTVGDIRYRALTAPGITVYAPVTQSPDRASEFMVRASAPAAVVIPAIRSRLLALNRNGIVSVAVMDQVLRVLEAPWYANLALFAAFAVISMLLATVGLYAMLAYSVVMQRREIGVRLVLGATAGRIALDIVADGARIIVAGSLIGVAMAIALLRLMAAILFGVSPTDPLTLVTAPLLFAVVAMIACAVPARRAARTEPAICLRAE